MIQKKFASSAKLSTLQIAEWFYHSASVPPGNDARKSCLNKHIVFFCCGGVAISCSPSLISSSKENMSAKMIPLQFCVGSLMTLACSYHPALRH